MTRTAQGSQRLPAQFWKKHFAAKAQLAEEGGHVLHTTHADEATQSVVLATLNNSYLLFHGCEINQLN